MKRSMLFKASAFVFLILISVFLVFGCSKNADQKSRPASKEKEVAEEKETGEEAEGEQTGKRTVLMMGRSVMYGWFQHWGCSDTSKPVKHGEYMLYYKELETPPDIVESVERHLDEVEDENTIVFFKFCFDDFVGGSKSEAKANLAENKEYVRSVYDLVVKQRKLKLIIGNALPKVKSCTDSYLVWNQSAYNKWLEEFAEKHQGEVYLFDQYSILSDSQDNLKKEYATNSEDSHPNDQAYSALDDNFFNFLEENF